jgi:nucleotide-binding universal stress UspA family protein
VSAGLHELFGISHGRTTQLVLIVVITLAATISLVTGVKKGIRRLSELNLILAALLLLFVFVTGPTGHLINAFVENLGGYAQVVLTRTFMIEGAGGEEGPWIRSWSVFYWGWWISWAPFVGMFVARISRGRTIRELIAGVLLVPTLVTFLWMTVFGNTALWLELGGHAEIAAAVSADSSTAIYAVLEQLPIGGVTSLLAAAVVSVFFVTSSDSASFVVDMLTSGGHPDPPRWQRVFWATAEGACAGLLLFAGGEEAFESLKALQAGVVTIGLPFCIVLIALGVSLVRGLREETTAAMPVAHPVLMVETEGTSPEEVPVKLDKILVPVDYSPPSADALRHAIELAGYAADGSSIDVLHVAPRPAEYLPMDRWIFGEDREPGDVDDAVRKAAREALDDFLDDVAPTGHDGIHPLVRLGIPSEVIKKVAGEEGYDLIVMGTHGRHGVDRVLMGSTAERVLRGAPCPVVTVR